MREGKREGEECKGVAGEEEGMMWEREEEEIMERGSGGTNDFTSSCGTRREGNSGREMDGCRNEGSGKRPVGLCWCERETELWPE